MDRIEPLVGALFRVDIDGLAGAAAVEVVFPEGRIMPEGEKRMVRYGPLTIRRGLTGSPDWYEWWDRARARAPRAQATGISRTVSVVLMDRSRTERQRWTFSNVVPIAYSVSPLNALSSAPLVESLELAVGGFDAAFALS